MKNETSEKAIESLINKAKDTDDAGEALRFTQAALNIAHVSLTIDSLKKK